MARRRRGIPAEVLWIGRPRRCREFQGDLLCDETRVSDSWIVGEFRELCSQLFDGWGLRVDSALAGHLPSGPPGWRCCESFCFFRERPSQSSCERFGRRLSVVLLKREPDFSQVLCLNQGRAGVCGQRGADDAFLVDGSRQDRYCGPIQQVLVLDFHSGPACPVGLNLSVLACGYDALVVGCDVDIGLFVLGYGPDGPVGQVGADHKRRGCPVLECDVRAGRDCRYLGPCGVLGVVSQVEDGLVGCRPVVESSQVGLCLAQEFEQVLALPLPVLVCGPADDRGSQGLCRLACLRFGSYAAVHVDCDRVGGDELVDSGGEVLAFSVYLGRRVQCGPEEDCGPGADALVDGGYWLVVGLIGCVFCGVCESPAGLVLLDLDPFGGELDLVVLRLEK